MNVYGAQQAAIMEHALSILNSAYTESGGMNVKTCGDQGMITSAVGYADQDTWQNGLRAIIEQGVATNGLKEVEERAELELLAQECEELQDNIDDEQLGVNRAVAVYIKSGKDHPSIG